MFDIHQGYPQCTLVRNTECKHTSDQLADFVVGCFPEEAQQGGHAAAVPQRHLVVVGGLAVHQVPQGPAGALLNLGHLVIQLVHQVLDPSQVTHLQTRNQSQRWTSSYTRITHKEAD